MLSIGGLELLWKQRKGFAPLERGEGPHRAEGAGAPEPLGWGEGEIYPLRFHFERAARQFGRAPRFA